MQLLYKNYFNFFLSLIVLLFCFTTWTVAQTTFQKTYGGTADEDIGNLIVTPDGGYVAVGNSNSCTSGDNDICIFKTDSAGILQWARSFGDVGNDQGSTVAVTENGYMVAGNLGVIGSNCDIFITRTDLEGKILWKKKYGGTGDDYVGVLQHTRDGNFIVAGGTTSYGRRLGRISDEN
jgi:hypothetical protein